MGCRRSAWLAISILFAAFSNSSSRSFCGSSSAIMLLFFGRCIRMGITSAFMGTDISLVRRRSMQSSMPIIATPFKLLSNNKKKKQDTRRRKRRGMMHSFQREKIRFDERRTSSPTTSLFAIPDNDNDEQSSAIIQQARTQYTINDSVCPPTDPNTLEKIVTKHIHTLPKYWNSKPIAKHTLVAFEEALDFVMQHKHHHHNTNDDTDSSTLKKTKVILDSGCGTGRSSILLGEMHTDCIVIGIDQSLSRLSRNEAYNNNQHEKDNINNATNNKRDNVLLLRAELSDFWKCCLSSSRWQKHVHIYKHYLLYPNPYPKKSRLKSRFYAHPAFPLLMMISFMFDRDEEGKVINESNENEKLIVRSNWEGYLKEFKLAINIWNNTGATVNEFREMITSDGNKDNDKWHPTGAAAEAALTHWEMVGPKQLDFEHGLNTPLTNFEAKYIDCDEPVYELLVHKSNKDCLR